MAKELDIRIWCDVCLTGGERNDAKHYGILITIGRTRGKTLDICDRHFTELIDPLLRAVRAYQTSDKSGYRPKPNRQIGPLRCQVAGCVAPPLKHADTLRAHVERLHDITWADYLEQYGEPTPLGPEDEEVVEAHCTVKGCGTVYSTALGHRWPHRELRSHTRTRHGLQT